MPALFEKMIIKYPILFYHGEIFNDLRIIRRSQIYNLIRQIQFYYDKSIFKNIISMEL